MLVLMAVVHPVEIIWQCKCMLPVKSVFSLNPFLPRLN